MICFKSFTFSLILALPKVLTLDRKKIKELIFSVLVYTYLCTLIKTKGSNDEYNNISLTHLRSCA